MTHKGELFRMWKRFLWSDRKHLRARRRPQKAQETCWGPDKKRLLDDREFLITVTETTARMEATQWGQLVQQAQRRALPLSVVRSSWRVTVPTLQMANSLVDVMQSVPQKINFIKFWKTVVTILHTRTLNGKEILDFQRAIKNFQPFTPHTDPSRFKIQRRTLFENVNHPRGHL